VYYNSRTFKIDAGAGRQLALGARQRRFQPGRLVRQPLPRFGGGRAQLECG